jgi:3-oxoacyl-[acyl-carrier protein] reductase
MAAGLVEAGHAVVLVDRTQDSLRETAKRLEANAPEARLASLEADLTDIGGLRRLATDAEAAFGPIDVLVNNAGLGIDHIRRDFMQRPVRFWEVEQDQAERTFAVNGLAPFLLARWLAPAMIARGFGRIVNVTTSLDTMIRGGFAPYGGTKASLEAHSAIMAQDLEGTGVTGTCSSQGGRRTQA